jgi:hypothetical protein
MSIDTVQLSLGATAVRMLDSDLPAPPGTMTASTVKGWDL